MNIYGVIYKATDPHGHCYIGQHFGDGSDIGKTYFGSGKYFNRVRKKRGKDYFTYWVFAKGLTQEERNTGEIYYIKFFQARSYQNGYNLTDGGGGVSGFEQTDESKKKRSISGKIAQNDPELKKKKAENWANKSEKEKSEFSNKMSEIGKIIQNKPENKQKRKEIWDNKSEEEKAEISRKKTESWYSKSEKERLEINYKKSKIWANKSEEDMALISEKHSNSWANKSDEEKETTIDKHIKSMVNRSEKDKENTRKKKKKTWGGKSDDEISSMTRKRLETNAQKSDEEKELTRKKNSEAQFIVQNRPENKPRQSEIGKYSMHIRWDVNRGIINPNCKFCVNGVSYEEKQK